MVSSTEYKKQYREHSEQYICYHLFYTYRYDSHRPPPPHKTTNSVAALSVVSLTSDTAGRIILPDLHSKPSDHHS